MTVQHNNRLRQGGSDSRLDAVERLIGIFKAERTIYTLVSAASVAILLCCAGYLMIVQNRDPFTLGSLLGAGGLVGYTGSRILRMFDQALQLAVVIRNDRRTANRLDAIERMIDLFKIERTIYLVVTSCSLILLFISGGSVVFKRHADPAVLTIDPAVLTMMFGSSGWITISANRLLRMWEQAIKLLTPDGKSPSANAHDSPETDSDQKDQE